MSRPTTHIEGQILGADKVLVTGAAGYIGSHACVELLDAGYDVVGVDNYDNSSPAAIDRVEQLAARKLEAMHELDLRQTSELSAVLADHDIDSVIHFAGLKAVGESVADPMKYYNTNLASTLSLVNAMTETGNRRLVFSSSCTVYGNPEAGQVPLTEDSPLEAVNPYGRTKLLIENMLADVCAADADWQVISLRYFNPIGAHPSGRIGDSPTGVPNNLLPYIMQVAAGVRDNVQVFGDDYPTNDGSCVRDYIHVVDIAHGHVLALEQLSAGYDAVNLGTGVGSSVLEMVAASEKSVGEPIPHTIVGRRHGDAASVYADPTKAREVLGWKAELDIQAMCDDHWRWQKGNPHGYT